jgi:thioredoxin-like negative regulator of GroEL
LAEEQIETALRTFSLFRGAKMMTLHHLAVLRHAQRRWGDAAELCRALLRQKLGTFSGLARQSRLILADSLLETGDLRGAHDALSALYQQRLSLAEALSLMAVQLDYLWRINAWDAMLDGLPTKVQLAELTSTRNAARVQALLALAARRVGRKDWEDYLRRRVELLTDVDELIKERPVLHELYQLAPAGQTVQASPPQPNPS